MINATSHINSGSVFGRWTVKNDEPISTWPHTEMKAAYEKEPFAWECRREGSDHEWEPSEEFSPLWMEGVEYRRAPEPTTEPKADVSAGGDATLLELVFNAIPRVTYSTQRNNGYDAWVHDLLAEAMEEEAQLRAALSAAQKEVAGYKAELAVRRHECRTQSATMRQLREKMANGEMPCPNCYGGHQRPCQWCGDSGWVVFESDATRKELSTLRAKIDELTREQEHAIEEAVEKEQARWQHRIDAIIVAAMPGIDGSGCDSGDPLDLTDTELELAFGKLYERIEALTQQLATVTAERNTLKKCEAVCHCGIEMSKHTGWDNHSAVAMTEPCPTEHERDSLREEAATLRATLRELTEKLNKAHETLDLLAQC